ncbi:hypothetical protein DsansV1_C13g0123031 [Dioscorea sansibarensis]
MANEDSKDLLKNMDWKTIGNSSTSAATEVVTKKRLPKKIRNAVGGLDKEKDPRGWWHHF